MSKEVLNKIDIKNFGLFKDYEWDKSFGKNNYFKRVNIIYGRNYSGKTTLARILRCIETKELHNKYSSAEFSLEFSDGTTMTQTNLDQQIKAQIRVYNTDFVNDNLQWLHNEDSTIKPFTILGTKNIEIEKKINEIESKLGSVEDKKGLLFELNNMNENYDKIRRNYELKKTRWDNQLKEKAKEIKNNASIFNVPVYNITHLTTDLSKTSIDKILNPEKTEELTKLLKEDPQSPIEKISAPTLDLADISAHTKSLVSLKILPSKSIQELVDNALLQEWVRQGISLHKDKKETCGFCGNIIPKDLWDKLSAHFNKESEDLRTSIEVEIQNLEGQKNLFSELLVISKDDFYVKYQSDFTTFHNSWEKLSIRYIQIIDQLISNLEKRHKDIFKDFELSEVQDISKDFNQLLTDLNKLIDKNNLNTTTLSNDQQRARDDLRLSFVAKYKKDIQYDIKVKEISDLEIDVKKADDLRNKKNAEVEIMLEEKRAFEAEAKDESRGAELVNQHLTNFFGHADLKLVADGQTPNMKFKITRDGIDANNLSEGECSLISFCYFIARMEDELKDEINNKNLVIFIDDPISSLDSNHIFFMFSLIESVIAKPKIYGQLFISTHNLDFLKYLKRITIPDSNDNVSYYLIERRQKKNDKKLFLLAMPKYIRDYVTEFNYLFNEIYKVYKEVSGDRKKELENTYNQFYNLPNNIRKFLECYLFYKYPNNNEPLKNLDILFDNNVPILIKRVINEYSHLTHIDRGWKPIDVDEAEDCAKIIIEKIKEKDIEQYNALIQSVNQN